MLLTPCLWLRKLIYLLSAVILLGFSTNVHATPKPLTKEEQAKVDMAIDRAVAFVKKSQKETGEFGDNPTPAGLYSTHGYAFFPALALLESGVSARDPVIQKVATMIRDLEPQLNRTYGISLAILFLDRLGEPKDEERIRRLALRLIAAQTYTGGWGYLSPLLSEQNESDLWKILRAFHRFNTQRNSHEKPAEPHRAAKAPSYIPPRLRALAIFQNPKNLFNRKEAGMSWLNPQPIMNTRYLIGTTDNSNTQFAVLALWAACRHDIFVDRTLALVVRRFLASQNEDGTWCYCYRFGGTMEKAPGKGCNLVEGTNCNIAAGLIGLATAHGIRVPIKESVKHTIHDSIVKALAILSKEIDKPAGQMDRPIRMKDLYFLWSVDRVATLYDLPLIGEKDWYRWGAEILVTNQKENGIWDCKGFPRWGNASIETSFGLLFLRRANWTKDLTAKLPLTGQKLNKSISARLRSLESPSSPSSASQSAANPMNPP